MILDDNWSKELNLGAIRQIKPVRGGDINQAFEVMTTSGNYFLKVQPHNDASFFEHEKAGLDLLGAVINAPKVIKAGSFQGNGYLVLNYLEFGTGSQFELGKMVAKMHLQTGPQFGLDHSVLNAKNPKINTWQDNWGDFFIDQRIKVLVDQVKQKVYWNDYRDNLIQKFESLVKSYYQDYLVEPSLLHGDLWNGNVGFLSNHQPILFDPDVFYGDREMDLAMTLLFGGFTEDFYKGYNSVYPLKKDWQKRMSWYQTYYLLAHLNLFGETYGTSFESALQQSIDEF